MWKIRPGASSFLSQKNMPKSILFGMFFCDAVNPYQNTLLSLCCFVLLARGHAGETKFISNLIWTIALAGCWNPEKYLSSDFWLRESNSSREVRTQVSNHLAKLFRVRFPVKHGAPIWGCQALGWSTKIAFPPTSNICFQASGHARGPNEKDTSPRLRHRQDANFAWQRQFWSSSPQLRPPPVNENAGWDPRREDSPRKQNA